MGGLFMANTRSFTEYVAKTFDNQFWAAAETYLDENIESLDIELLDYSQANGHTFVNYC
jgi:hypothetical protein